MRTEYDFSNVRKNPYKDFLVSDDRAASQTEVTDEDTEETDT